MTTMALMAKVKRDLWVRAMEIVTQHQLRDQSMFRVDDWQLQLILGRKGAELFVLRAPRGHESLVATYVLAPDAQAPQERKGYLFRPNGGGQGQINATDFGDAVTQLIDRRAALPCDMFSDGWHWRIYREGVDIRTLVIRAPFGSEPYQGKILDRHGGNPNEATPPAPVQETGGASPSSLPGIPDFFVPGAQAHARTHAYESKPTDSDPREWFPSGIPGPAAGHGRLASIELKPGDPEIEIDHSMSEAQERAEPLREADASTARALTGMTKEQHAHLQYLIHGASTRMRDKYVMGAREHGGNLWDLDEGTLIEHAIEEAVDQLMYLMTIQEKLKQRLSQAAYGSGIVKATLDGRPVELTIDSAGVLHLRTEANSE